MNQKFGFEIMGQWTFGMDMIDLYRFMRLGLQKENKQMLDLFQNKFMDCLDPLQKILDESDFADEIHIIVRVRH